MEVTSATEFIRVRSLFKAVRKFGFLSVGYSRRSFLVVLSVLRSLALLTSTLFSGICSSSVCNCYLKFKIFANKGFVYILGKAATVNLFLSFFIILAF